MMILKVSSNSDHSRIFPENWAFHTKIPALLKTQNCSFYLILSPQASPREHSSCTCKPLAKIWNEKKNPPATPKNKNFR